jgi:hypothetical protein
MKTRPSPLVPISLFRRPERTVYSLTEQGTERDLVGMARPLSEETEDRERQRRNLTHGRGHLLRDDRPLPAGGRSSTGSPRWSGSSTPPASRSALPKAECLQAMSSV